MIAPARSTPEISRESLPEQSVKVVFRVLLTGFADGLVPILGHRPRPLPVPMQTERAQGDGYFGDGETDEFCSRQGNVRGKTLDRRLVEDALDEVASVGRRLGCRQTDEMLDGVLVLGLPGTACCMCWTGRPIVSLPLCEP
jgi:hypothetical protein